MAAPPETDEELHARAALEHITRALAEGRPRTFTKRYLALAGLDTDDTPPQGNEDLL